MNVYIVVEDLEYGENTNLLVCLDVDVAEDLRSRLEATNQGGGTIYRVEKHSVIK